MARPRMSRRGRINPKTEETLRARQAALSALTRHPSWEALIETLDQKATRMEKVALAQALGGSAQSGANVAELQWIKGFIAGMRYLAAVPTQAEDSLRRFLEQQGISMEGVE